MKWIVLVSLVLAGCHHVNGGDELRNGGDPVAKRIEAGRDKARRLLDAVENLAPQDLPVGAEGMQKFYREHRLDLREDIAASPHEWSPRNANGACGATSTARGAKIVFSYSQCSEVKLEIDAALQLIGESVHHMGVDSDSFTAAIAVGVGRAWVRYLGGLPAGANRRFLFAEARAFLVGVLRHLAYNGPQPSDLATLATAIDEQTHEWRDELADGECAQRTAGSSLVLLSHSACESRERSVAARSLLVAELKARSGLTTEAATREAEAIFTAWRDRGFTEGTQLASLKAPKPKRAELDLDTAPVVWTGREAVAWGLAQGGKQFQIARFNPAREMWRFTYTEPAPATEPALYVDGRLLIAADCKPVYVYDLENRRWVTLETTGGWRLRAGAQPVVMGDRFALIGGHSCEDSARLGGGSLYSFATKTWKAISAHPAIEAGGHTSTVVDGKPFVWGPAGGAIFNPVKGAFVDLPTAGGPEPRVRPIAIAFGHEVMVWGGQDGQHNYLRHGAIYDTDAKKWRPVATKGAPSEMPTLAVAAGPNLAFLGAETFFYNSLRDVWTAIPHASVSQPRAAFWNGGQILIWLGTNNFAIYP